MNRHSVWAAPAARVNPGPPPAAGGGGNLLPVPMTSGPRVFVGLGANVGDREENLRQVVLHERSLGR